ncbi:MAG: FtsX-like permease family protein [Gammaproteobacteria bacterium]|nr:FtsX-like permease family protein [Gammaproteobacteria bacterium]
MGELALALLLLSGATLLIRSFLNLSAVELGFRTERVLTFSLSLPEARYPEPRQAARTVERFLDAAEASPGVEAAAGVFGLPLGGISYMFNVQTMDGRTVDDDELGGGGLVQTRLATPDYLRVMGIPLRAGRFIEPSDRPGAERVVVLSETAARALFPDGDPLGHTIELGTDLGLDGPRVGGRVVGVIGDVHHFGPAREAPPEAYFAHAQFPVRSLSVTVRTAGAPGAVLGALRERLAEIDPELPLYRVRTMGGLAAASVTRPRFYMTLLTLFGAVALALAAVGTYGSINYSVERRSREIGIRMAMGARRVDVVGMVVGRVARLAALGLAIGLAAGLLVTRVLDRLLFELSSTDPLTMAVTALILAVVALAAGYLPARRATRVDPMTVLRTE